MQNGIAQQKKTIISNTVSIVGNITAEGDIIINGKMKGNVEINNYCLVLDPDGRLEGEVQAQDVRISGHMKGEIKAKGKVEITKAAKFSGQIECKVISVEEGAYLDASVNVGRESHGTKALKETPSEKPEIKELSDEHRIFQPKVAAG